jgi:alanine-alpha-ketoisovalerate/valine-pyruvate aminotransferase
MKPFTTLVNDNRLGFTRLPIVTSSLKRNAKKKGTKMTWTHIFYPNLTVRVSWLHDGMQMFWTETLSTVELNGSDPTWN